MRDICTSGSTRERWAAYGRPPSYSTGKRTERDLPPHASKTRNPPALKHFCSLAFISGK